MKIGWRGLFTDIGLDLSDARFTLDRAAPLKFAVALLLFKLALDVVATAAAQVSAAIWTVRVLVALATTRALDEVSTVLAAKVGTLVHVDEVLLGRLAVAFVPFVQLVLLGLVLDLDGAVVLLLEVVADLAEVGHLEPTGLHATRARDAMTLALDLDHSVDGSAARFVIVQVDEAAGSSLVGVNFAALAQQVAW